MRDNRGIRRMKIDGHCHCGEITFEAEVDPDALNICHCTDCQTLSGTAFRVNIPAPAEHFVLLSGTPKTYIKTAELRRPKAAINAGTPSAVIAARRSMPALWTIRRPMPCASVRLPSVRPSHRGGRFGGVLLWIGSTRSPPCLRPRKGDAPSECANYKNRTGENACGPSPVL